MFAIEIQKTLLHLMHCIVFYYRGLTGPVVGCTYSSRTSHYSVMLVNFPVFPKSESFAAICGSI